MRFLLALALQKFYRPRRPDPLGFVTPPEPVLTPKQTFELLDQMDGDLWRHLVSIYGVSGALEHLAPRRQSIRRWFP